MPTVSLAVKKRCAKGDSMTPVYLQYMYDHDNRTMIQTDIRIPLSSWDTRHRKVKNNLPGDFEKTTEEINMELSTLIFRLKKLYSDALKVGTAPTISYIKKHFSLIHDPAKEEKVTKVLKPSAWNIYDHVKDYIENKKKDVARDTVKDYNSLIKHLKGFASYSRQQINFNSYGRGSISVANGAVPHTKLFLLADRKLIVGFAEFSRFICHQLQVAAY